jgi:hypothetical protein
MYGMVAFYVYYYVVNAKDMQDSADILWHAMVGFILAFVWPIPALMIAFDKIKR